MSEVAPIQRDFDPSRRRTFMDIEEALHWADFIIEAGLAPDSYKIGGNGANRDLPDRHKVAVGILKGDEVGFRPITAMQWIAVINGRPSIYGDGAMGLVIKGGEVANQEFVWEGDAERATGPTEQPGGDLDYTPSIADFPDTLTAVYRIWRKGQPNPYEGRFSVRDAKRAKLWGNFKREPWIKSPKRMLFNRARAFAIRDGFAKELCGLSIREEIEDMPPPPPERLALSFLDDTPSAAIRTIEHKPEEPLPGPLDGVKPAEPLHTPDPATPPQMAAASASPPSSTASSTSDGEAATSAGGGASEPDDLDDIPEPLLTPRERDTKTLKAIHAKLLTVRTFEERDRVMNDPWIDEFRKRDPERARWLDEQADRVKELP